MNNIDERKFLDVVEISKLIMFNADEKLKDAVKKMLLYFVYNSEILRPGESAGIEKHWVYGVLQDPKISDEEIGKNVRAKVYALGLLEEAFKEISKFTPEEEPKEEKNPAV